MFTEFYYKEFKVAYLHNKFGRANSIQVPDRMVTLEEFIDVKDVLRTTAGREKIRPYGVVLDVTGEVLLPGEWNYCLIDGHFYHLEKTAFQGVKKDGDYEERWYFYTFIGDDGMSAYMRNEIYLSGTINLTGDRELVEQHLLQTTPIISNVNDLQIGNGIRTEGRSKLKFKQADVSLFGLKTTISNRDYFLLNELLESLNLGEPNEEKLILPLVYKSTTTGNGKGKVLRDIETLAKQDLGVYDLSDVAPKGVLQGVLSSTEVYSVSSRENVIFTYASKHNPTKYVDEIDLTGCTDLRELDPLTFNHKYSYVEGQDNPVPKFIFRTFIDKLFKKLGLDKLANRDVLKQKLIDIGSEEISKLLGKLVTYDDYSGVRRSNVFKNVEIEPIDRQVTYTNELNTNVEGNEIFKYPFPYIKFYKNFIFDDESTQHEVMLTLKDGAFQTDEDKEKLKELKRKVDTNDITEFNKLIKEEIPKYFETTNPLQDYKNINLVLFTHKFKMTCQGCEDQLDGSRGATSNDQIFAIVPDYRRKTHVLCLGRYIETDMEGSKSDSQISEPGRVKLLVLSELSEVARDSNEVLKHPPDFMETYTDNLKKDEREGYRGIRASEVLRQGHTFSYLMSPYGYDVTGRNSHYDLLYKHYYSQCSGYNYCTGSDGNGDLTYPNKTAFQFRGPILNTPYVDEGKTYPIEFTFPVQTHNHNILKILEEYSDLSDELLKGEVLNPSEEGKKAKDKVIKKGKIKRYSFRVDDRLQVTGHNKESEKLVPSNTVVCIGLDSCYDVEVVKGKGPYDNQIKSKYSARAYELIKRLYIIWFKERGNDKTLGGIPNGINNESHSNNKRDPVGRSILRFTWVKPYDGYYYTASIRFPSIDLTRASKDHNDTKVYQRMLFHSSGGFNHENSKDGFIALVPNPYNTAPNGSTSDKGTFAADRVFPVYSYRQKVTSISREAILAFLFNGYKYALTENIPEDKSVLVQRGYGPYPDVYSSHKYRKGQNYRESVSWYLDNRLQFPGQQWNLDGGGAVRGHEMFLRSVLPNKDCILGSDLVKRGLKTDRTNNPTKLRTEYKYGGDQIKVIDLDEEIPPFMVKFFDIDNPALCEHFHSWTKPSNKTAEAFSATLEDVFREKIIKHCNSIKILLSTNNHIFELTGTKWIVSIKLNIDKDNLLWNFELFTKDRTLIKDADEEKGEFQNTVENDVDILINTTFEFNVHGKRIPIKTRFNSKEERLDPGLYLKPIHDPRQTETAVYYKLTLLNEDVLDTFGTTIEIPKEGVKYTGMSPYEKEMLMRQITISNIERAAERDLGHLNVKDFQMGDSFSERANRLKLSYDTTNAGIDLVTNAVGGFAKATLSPDLPSKLLAGMGAVTSVMKGYTNISRTYDEHYLEEDKRKQRYQHGIGKFDIEGRTMTEKHKANQEIDRIQIGAMSNNIVYPQTTNLLIYKQINKQMNLEDIFLIRYFPQGQLLKYIKRWYYEYGYEILVRNFVCNGQINIRRHLRYSVIEQSEYPSEPRKSVIESRALNGIKVTPGI